MSYLDKDIEQLQEQIVILENMIAIHDLKIKKLGEAIKFCLNELLNQSEDDSFSLAIAERLG